MQNANEIQNPTKRFQVQITRWVTVAEFDTVEEHEAYQRSDADVPPEFDGQQGRTLDTRPDTLVIDSWL